MKIALVIDVFGIGKVPVEVIIREFVNVEGGDEPHLQRKFRDYEILGGRFDGDEKAATEVLNSVVQFALEAEEVDEKIKAHLSPL